MARLLRWERYAADASARLPRFDATFVARGAARGSPARARSRPRTKSANSSSSTLRPPRRSRSRPPYVLVVHSGPDEETNDLVACARELLAGRGKLTRGSSSPRRPGRGTLPTDVTWLDAFPATGLFARAERIVTAAGFNAVRQTAPFRAKRFLVPYPAPVRRPVHARGARTSSREMTSAPPPPSQRLGSEDGAVPRPLRACQGSSGEAPRSPAKPGTGRKALRDRSRGPGPGRTSARPSGRRTRWWSVP